MPPYPSKVDYVWTELDAVNAAAGYEKPTAEQTVSPYGVPAKALPGAGKNYKAGEKINLDLSLRNQGFPWKLDWRFPKDGTLEWIDVPAEVTGFKTVSELCAALLKHNKTQFPAKFYDLNGEGKAAKIGASGWDTAPNMIFDYWENSKWRYEQSIRKGKFSWADDKGKVEIPAGTKIKVLGKKPVKVTVPAGPGLLVTKDTDKLFKELKDDLLEIIQLTTRINELFVKCEEVMKERTKLVHGINALKATFWACSTDSTDFGSRSAANNYGKASQCAKKAKKMAKEIPMKEVFEPFKGGSVHSLPAGLEEQMRQMMGQSDDMAAEIKNQAWKLKNKLTFDMFFAGRCGQFAKLRLEKKLQDDAVWKQMHDLIVSVLAAAFTALAEADSSDNLGEELFNLHATMPQKPAATAAELSQSMSNPAEIVLSMVGNASVDVEKAWKGQASVTKDNLIPTTLVFVGNLAGPPSLSIAIIQAAASSSLPKAAAATSAAAGSGKMSELGEKVLASLDRHFNDTKEAKELAANIRKAFKANDQDALFDLKKGYGEKIAGTNQVSLKWKGGIAILQILSAVMAIRSCLDEKKEVKFMDYVGAGVASVQAGLATVELICTALGAWRDGTAVHTAISGAGLWVGRLSAVLGIIMGVIALDEAASKGDNVGIFVACTQIFGNFFLLMGLLTTAVPGLQLVGLAILAVGVVVQLYQALTADPGFTPTNTNRVAAQVYGFITSNKFYDVFCAHDADFKTAMKELSKAASGEYLPYARNTIGVHEQLKRHGFGPEEIKLLVNTSDVPMDFMLAGALPQYEI